MSKHIFITGSTDGIGKLAAIKLAKEGHHMYIHGRNPQKLSTVTDEIKDLTNNENIIGFVSDFSDMQSVRELAQKVNTEVKSLDVIINNAGILKSQTPMTKDGLDIRFAVNFFAPYLLTNALIGLLQNSDDPRIINLSSAAQAPISEAAFLGKREQSAMESYSQSKLAITMWSVSLAKAYPAITVIPVNPGSLLNTNMVKEAFGHHRSSADKGADILYDLAISENHKSHSGDYFDNDRGSYGHAFEDAYDEDKITKLMESTEALLASN